MNLTAPEFSALFSGISASIVVVGVFFTLRNLRIIARTNRMQAFDAFEKRWESTKAVRLDVLENFVFDHAAPPALDSDMGGKIRELTNNINVIGSMLENRLLPAHLVLGLCYPDFIRCEIRLRPYLEHRSLELGIGYGRRVTRLALRARRYHDLRHGTEVIRTKGDDGGYEVVYAPTDVRGAARTRIWIERAYRDAFKRY